MSNFFNRLADFFGRYMFIPVVLVTVLAYFVENSFVGWVNNPDFLSGNINITYLLMIIMCGMGMTMKLKDFLVVLMHPKEIIVGEIAQFLIMPVLGLVLCFLFRLPPDLATGVILVGCCPGGTASNVITYMAKGDVALSVGMTSVSTMLAPFLTPLLTALYISVYTSQNSGADIHLDVSQMFIEILKIVIVPIIIGLVFSYFLPRITAKLIKFLPMISAIAICIIIGFVIDANSSRLFEHGFIIILVVMLHNIMGFVMGYLAGLLIRTMPARRSAIAIEVGMQNSGMATQLAASCFSSLQLATVPGAIFSAWHNISGTVLAYLLAGKNERKESSVPAVKKQE